MLAVLHSLLVFQNFTGVYSDLYLWSMSDLGFAISQMQAIGCDLQSSVDDAVEILTYVYAAGCRSQSDVDQIRAFIFRVIGTLTTRDDVMVQLTIVAFVTLKRGIFKANLFPFAFTKRSVLHLKLEIILVSVDTK